MIVVDASVVVHLLLHGRGSDRLSVLLTSASLHAPHLLDLEVAQTLRRRTAVRELSEERARESLAALSDIPLQRHPHQPLLSRVWSLRYNVTAYDAVYVALAESLEAPLVTLDRKLKDAPGIRAQIELV